ncbi:uncharacterized protein LOC118739497 [Rhagoletis pomonella]|uniref:uncharacterized protein LOC118739497 n=1 Tax=Rhagoletis pomonella TaxID=28610 RepID=UPI00177DBB66|nr:uncharacterized protein LOC118739497 [Rhagoletis pomonella]
MSDSPNERNSNSKSNLIEVQHVGVTAKLQSPLKNLLQSSTSSTETENGLLFNERHGHKHKYNKFSNDTQADTETGTENPSKVLYEMRAVREISTAHPGKRNATPSKIEFQLYKTASRRARRTKSTHATGVQCSEKKSKRKLFAERQSVSAKKAASCCTCYAHSPHTKENTIFQRLRKSLDNMRTARPHISKPKAPKCSEIFIDLPEPCTSNTQQRSKVDEGKQSERDVTPPPARETRIGIYPFEHGCAEYLRTTDCHPQMLSVVLAERATYYATRFWAEFFGSLHIGVTFVVTFLLQAYRFVLYSLVNTLVVGFLHMTSDYLIKPILTVFFNGFLQPPLILVYNILTSIRDILEPVADTINNFMRPVATVGKSLRLVHANYNTKKFEKEV